MEYDWVLLCSSNNLGVTNSALLDEVLGQPRDQRFVNGGPALPQNPHVNMIHARPSSGNYGPGQVPTLTPILESELLQVTVWCLSAE